MVTPARDEAAEAEAIERLRVELRLEVPAVRFANFPGLVWSDLQREMEEAQRG